jgi:hypothetical protein
MLFAGALAAFLATRLAVPRLPPRQLLRVAALLLLLAGAITAARSVQVV